MTKNEAQAKQIVRIFSADGEQIGTTYPKRAAGLVKKGRAHFVNDCDIRLNVSDVLNYTEEITMMDNNTTNTNNSAQTEPVNKLYFDAREWTFNKEIKNNVGNRSFMQGPDGVINEAYMIGNWGWDWTEIVSKTLLLPKNTLNTFTFWLNGGENDRNDEVCRFEVIFNNDYDNRYTYNLNRNFIKPIKKSGGWELYEIPFRTGDNEYTQLKFIAMRAYMTVMTARDVSEYAKLPDTEDKWAKYRPQRHNIIFEDGWPNNTQYSTMNLEAKFGVQQGQSAPNPQSSAITQQFTGTVMDGLQGTLQGLQSFDFEGLAENIRASLQNDPNLSPEDIEEIVNDALMDARESIIVAIEEINDAIGEICEIGEAGEF